ncbi:MAG: DUF4118 domain-containing protein [Planctomycetes bacterium]|nr:DUF4118 domain-containing protein [Planctomycetota bacterium]
MVGGGEGPAIERRDGTPAAPVAVPPAASAAAPPSRAARPFGPHAEVALVIGVLLLVGVGFGDWFAFFALMPSPLLLPVLWGALRGGLMPALTAAVLCSALHVLGVVAATDDLAAVDGGALSWPTFAFAAVGYVVGQTRDLLARRIAALQTKRVALQAEAQRHRRSIEVLEHANGELKRRIFDRSFDLDSLVATVARSSIDDDEHMFETPLTMLTDFCGASKCSVLLVLPDGTLDLAAHNGWGEAEIGPRLARVNRDPRVMRAIVEAKPIVELADEEESGGPLLIAPIADGTGAIKVLVCIDEMAPSRFEETTVKTFLGIVSWLSTNLRRIQMRESTSENRAEMLSALDKTKQIGSLVHLAERIHLEDARRKRYGVETELIAIRLLDMRVTMEDYIEALETRLLHVLNTTVRLTDDVFTFGFAGCYILLLTGCKPEHSTALVNRLEERFAACEGPDFGPVEVRHFATTTEAPTLADLLLPVTEHFCGTSPIPLAQQCPVPEPRAQRGGNAEGFARRLRLETDLAQRLGAELNMIDFRRDGPGFGVGAMIARHLWNCVGTLLRVTDGIYVVNPNRCVVLLPFTSCLDASMIWSRLDETLRSTLPEDHYDGVRCDFLALDAKNLRDTVHYLVGADGDGPDGAPTAALTESELQELAFSDLEFSDLRREAEDLERDFRVIATSGAELPTLPSGEEITRRWEEVFESTEPGAAAAAAAEPREGGGNHESQSEPQREPRQIVMNESGRPRLPDAAAMNRRFDEIFDATATPAVVEPDEPTQQQQDAEEEPEMQRRDTDTAEAGPPSSTLSWRTAVDDVLVGLAKAGEPFTITDVRATAAALGIGEPEHANAWGAVVTAAKRRGLIAKTGRLLRSEREGRNAGLIAEWVGVAAAFEASKPTPAAGPALRDLEREIERLRAELAAVAAEEPVRSASAAAPSWRAVVAGVVAECAAKGSPFTSADVKELASRRGAGPAPHPNAWGAVITAAKKRGLIEKTGRYVKSAAAGRHAASIAEWVGTAVAAAERVADPDAGGVAEVPDTEAPTLDHATLAELQRQVAEVHALLAGGGVTPPIAPPPVSPTPVPAQAAGSDDYETLRLLRQQIEGLFALCLRHSDRSREDAPRA